jgi:phosphatidylglycerophosphatase C
MGTPEALRQSAADRPIVAFDFDGTLTVRDSFTAFLAWRVGPVAYGAGLASLLPALAAYAADRDRGRLKAAAAGRFLGRRSEAQITQDAEQFAALSSPALLRPDALACWRQWQARGALMLIVTASPEITIAPFARALGADGLIGTRLAFDAQGRFDGHFASENCRGPEKVSRLRAQFGPDLRLAAAYGDTSGDREMLALADIQGYRVFKARP